MTRSWMIATALLMAACGTQDGISPPETPPTETTLGPGSSLDPESRADVTDREPSPIESWVIADLAERLEVAPETIEVESVESGVWADGSIGCPDPDTVYTQALVPGARVSLSHDGDVYVYHQGGSGDPFLCESPVEGAFTGVEGDLLIPPPGYDD
jgi:hypothetical protein